MIEMLKKRKKIVQMLLAIAISLVGQWMLSKDFFLMSGFLFFLAIAIFVTASSQEKNDVSRSSDLNGFLKIRLTRNSRYLFGSALLLALMAFFLFEVTDNTLFAWVIHIASVLVMFVGIHNLSLLNQAGIDRSDKMQISESAIFIGILVFGAVVRFIGLESLPYGLWYDEADFGIKAVQLLSSEGSFPVFFSEIRVPAYFIYLISLSFKIFGTSVAALRFVSAFFGVATIAAAYFLGRELFGRNSGLLLAFFFAFSRWDLNWSRIGLDNITVPFFEMLVIALLYRAFRRRSLLHYGLAGIALGLGLSFYASMRLFPAVILVWLLFQWYRQRNFLKAIWPGLVIFLMVFIISIVPITQYAIFHPGPFWSRINETSIFKGRTFSEAIPAVIETTREHLLMFNYKGDQNGRHNLPGQPMLDPITGALMMIGLGVALHRWKNPRYLLLVAWFLIMLAPGIFSLDFESPQSLRAIGSMPAVYLLALLPMAELGKQNASEYISVIKKGVFIVFAGLLSFILVYNLSLYFTYQSQANSSWIEFSTRETIIGREMADLGNEAEYFLSTFYDDAPSIRFLAPQVTTTHKLETYDVFPLDNTDGKRSIFYIDPEREPLYDLANRYFPGGDFSKIKSPEGTTIMYRMDLLPADFQQNQGLRASYYENPDFSGFPFFVERQHDFQINWDQSSYKNFPYAVEWDGVLYAPYFGRYYFEIRSNDEATLLIDDQLVPVNSLEEGNEGIVLAKGNHNIRIQTQVTGGKFSLLWQIPEGEMQDLTTNFLFVAPITANGLLGQYFASPDWSGEAAYAQIDPFINFYYHNQPLPRPYSVEWQGKLLIPEDGEYLLGLQSIDESRLYIDENLVINNESRDAYVETAITLTEGSHRIRVQYADRTGYTYIKLYWTPPDGEKEIIPQAAFSFP